MSAPSQEIEVPAKWRGCEFEYRDGFRHGLTYGKHKGRYNPIAHRGVNGVQRRAAWYAGHKDGLRAQAVE